MYVRNYGIPPRGLKREGETAYLKTEPGAETEHGSDITEEERAVGTEHEVDKTAPHEELTDESGKAPCSSDGDEVGPSDATQPRFGERGIPPQPLRRRRLPKRAAPPPETPLPILPDVPDGTAKEENIRADSGDTERGSLCEESGKQNDRENEPHVNERERRHPKRSRERILSDEEILLGGLILLLINDRADDDILMVLSFLFISGWHVSSQSP